MSTQRPTLYTEIEDYLLGRIASLEDIVRKYASNKDDLPLWRTRLNEARITLKAVRAIAAKKKGKG